VRTGLSDHGCDWMQKQLGRRSPREKGVRASEAAVEAKSFSDWQQEQNEERHRK
jgi:hypothetical protein